MKAHEASRPRRWKVRGVFAPGRTPVSALEHALERAGDGVFITDAGGHIVMWNEAAEKILGYGVREVIGRTCPQILDKLDAGGESPCCAGCRPLNGASNGTSAPSFDVQARSKAGNPVWINVSILALPATPHSAEVIVHMFRDVTTTHGPREGFPAQLNAMPPGEAPGIEALLSRREIEILKLMGSGLRTGDVAARLDISRATVRNHVQNILAKLGVHSRLEAVILATRRHWL